MTREIFYPTATAANYVAIVELNGQYWNGSGFENPDDANIALYQINLTIDDSGNFPSYSANFPLAATKNYNCRIYKRAATTLTIADLSLLYGFGTIGPNGQLPVNGLDLIDDSEPAGLIGSFRERMSLLMRRFLNKSVKNASAKTLSVYNDAGSSVIFVAAYTTSAPSDYNEAVDALA